MSEAVYAASRVLRIAQRETPRCKSAPALTSNRRRDFGWDTQLPGLLDKTLALVAEPAAPLSLIVLGMGLGEYEVRSGWRQTFTICFLKLILQPLVVWLLARAIHLPDLETRAVVLLASLPVGANVYLMSLQHQRLEGTVAASLVLSTAISALSTPLILVLLGQH